MKEKLAAELKRKFSGQATAKFLEQLAERLSGKVAKEEDIEVVIAELEASPIRIADLQSEGDRRVTDAQAKWKTSPGGTQTPKPDSNYTSTDEKGDAPASIIAKLDALEKKLEEMQTQNVGKILHEKLVAKLKQENIPVSLAVGISLKSESEVETSFDLVKTRYADVREQMKKEGIIIEVPKSGDQAKNQTEQLKLDVEKYSKKLE